MVTLQIIVNRSTYKGGNSDLMYLPSFINDATLKQTGGNTFMRVFDTYHAMGRFSRQQTDDIFLIFFCLVNRI